MIHLNLPDLSDDAMAYLDACARIRHISRHRLMERMLATICEEQLVLSVLDDDSRPAPRRPGEASRSRYHRAHVFSSLKA